MNLTDRNDDFDWITARSACSLRRIFDHVADLADSYIKTANKLRQSDRVRFWRNPSPDRISIEREWDLGSAKENSTVIFVIEAAQISVLRRPAGLTAPEPWFAATPLLDEDGHCYLQVEGQPMRVWQFARKALEGLFFE